MSETVATELSCAARVGARAKMLGAVLSVATLLHPTLPTIVPRTQLVLLASEWENTLAFVHILQEAS
ncbi:MAG TPA: hypothetical protein VFK13_01490 [Gemmatimonadaceae bacterium]|nr:hypothetical protein [Gemmatimonadaceae bacterium]